MIPIRVNEHTEDKVIALLAAMSEQDKRKYDLCLISALDRETGAVCVFLAAGNIEEDGATGNNVAMLVNGVGRYVHEIGLQRGGS